MPSMPSLVDDVVSPLPLLCTPADPVALKDELPGQVGLCDAVATRSEQRGNVLPRQSDGQSPSRRCP